MVQKILLSSNPELRQKSKAVKKLDAKVKNIIKDLKDTLVVQKDPEGVGLAAPQIGKFVRIFVMRHEDNSLETVINPEIVTISKLSKKDTKVLEGCLSIPHYYGPLSRAKEITIRYMNEEGEKVTKSYSKFNAQIVQHEIDHLEGKLFVDHLLEQKKPLYKYYSKTDEWEEVDFANI